LTAWVSVALAHILKYSSGKSYDTPPSAIIGHSAFRMRGLIAWACSAIIGLCILRFLANGAIWSTPACFVIAWVVYHMPPGVSAPAA
jgi:hypothetical protein